MEQHQHLQLHRHPEGVHHCSSALLVHDLQVCRRVEVVGPPADEVVRGRGSASRWADARGCARALRALVRGRWGRPLVLAPSVRIPIFVGIRNVCKSSCADSDVRRSYLYYLCTSTTMRDHTIGQLHKPMMIGTPQE